jgi:hypothetical protein
MKLPASLALVFAFVLAAAPLASAQTPGYDYTSVYYPGSANTAVYAINDAGIFVGALKETGGAHRAILGTAGSLALLGLNTPLAAAKESWAFTVNRHGDVGGAYFDAAGVLHGYVLRASGAFEVVDRPGWAGTEVWGINAGGTIVGISTDASGATSAYRLRGGSFESVDLPGMVATYPYSVNDFEEIAGEAVKTAGTNGYGYLQGPRGRVATFTAPGSAPEQTYFISVNDRNVVLGGYSDAAGNSSPFIRDRAGYRMFELPPSFDAVYTSAATINTRGDVVGWYYDSAFVAHGFVARVTSP